MWNAELDSWYSEPSILLHCHFVVNLHLKFTGVLRTECASRFIELYCDKFVYIIFCIALHYLNKLLNCINWAVEWFLSQWSVTRSYVLIDHYTALYCIIIFALYLLLLLHVCMFAYLYTYIPIFILALLKTTSSHDRPIARCASGLRRHDGRGQWKAD